MEKKERIPSAEKIRGRGKEDPRKKSENSFLRRMGRGKKEGGRAIQS